MTSEIEESSQIDTITELVPQSHEQQQQPETHEASSSHLAKLAEDVEELVDLTQQIDEANKSLKIIRARKKELHGTITTFMQDNGIEVINSKSGGQIKLAQRTKLGKVDRSYLEETLATKLGREPALDLVSFAFENRTSEETKSIRVATKKVKSNSS